MVCGFFPINSNRFVVKARYYFAALVTIIFQLILVASFYLTTRKHDSWITASCFVSQSESDSFFCEPNYMWNERKRIYEFQDRLNMRKASDTIFFKSNWEANFYCSHKVRIGKMGDGGKWVCDPFKLREKSDCLVYSAGSNGDFSFEIELKKLLPKCSIFTIDKDNYLCPKDICTFHQASLGSGSTMNSKPWSRLIQELNHTRQVVDIFKIDIEGYEYEFFTDMFNSNISIDNFPRQILVEVHPANVSEMHRFFEVFRKKHYIIFNREPNFIVGPTYFEYAFLRLNAAFFRSR